MRRLLVAEVIAALLGLPACSPALTLATGGQAKAIIVTASDPTRAEATAARELAEYLGRVTGGEFPLVTEGEAPTGGVRLFVGATDFARGIGVDPATLGPEEWLIRSQGDNLLLTGGRPRGTLYAVYRFLEDVVGVHWWNPWEEFVPSRPTLDVIPLNLRGQPVLRYRDIYMLYGNDGGRFGARNRLNRQGDAAIEAEYGGSRDYGPPYHVHTFYNYCPPEEHFAAHPEWFSLIGGQRVGKQAQLCLTNPELRQFMLGRLRAWIQESREAAAATDSPPAEVFSVSQNDWGGACQCNECQAIAQAEGSEAGPLLDFLNYLADGIREDYPDVYLDTLAYAYTQRPPNSIRPRDNVIIRLCDTDSNFLRPITHPDNTAFREHLLRWASIARNLRVWDYAVTYAPYTGFPMPTAHTYPVDYRFYAENNVEGVFTELEYEVLADMRDFKVWMMMKCLEDPYRDYDALVQTFTDGFYGPAGALVREYLALLEAAAEKYPSYVSMGGAPRAARYLTLSFIQEAQTLFDRAEQAVAGDATLLRRVRHARLPLDRAGVVLFRDLVTRWKAQGHAPEAFPLDRDALARRYKDTWRTEAQRRLTGARLERELREVEAEVVALTAIRPDLPLPERFRHLPPATVLDFTADTARNWNNIVQVVPDPEAESGVTCRLEFPTHVDTDQHPVERYKLPMPWGLYDVKNARGAGAAGITEADVPGPGYHWYKMGEFPIGPSYYVYFFWSWIIQFDVDTAADPDHPDRKFEVWARVKFEGPSFPHGRPQDRDAICVERVVLVAKEEG